MGWIDMLMVKSAMPAYKPQADGHRQTYQQGKKGAGKGFKEILEGCINDQGRKVKSH